MILGTSSSTNKYVNVPHDSLDMLDNTDVASENMEESTKHKNKINVILDDVSLEKVSSTKFLGVIIDENLTWKNHIDAISKTISRNIGILTKLKHYVMCT